MPVIRWDSGPVVNRTKQQLAAGMRKAMEELRAEVVKSISRPQQRRVVSGRAYGLNPSRPGEPPKVVTGNLRQNQRTAVRVRANSVSGFVGSNLKKQRFLELGTRTMKPRPHLRPAVRRKRRDILRALLRG